MVNIDKIRDSITNLIDEVIYVSKAVDDIEQRHDIDVSDIRSNIEDVEKAIEDVSENLEEYSSEIEDIEDIIEDVYSKLSKLVE